MICLHPQYERIIGLVVNGCLSNCQLIHAKRDFKEHSRVDVERRRLDLNF